jgi:signal transduction histidine kinase
VLQGSGIGIWELELTDPALPNARLVHTSVFEDLGYGLPQSRPDVPAILDLIHPEDRPRIAEAYQAIVAGETDKRELEYRLRHRDGSYRTMLMRGVAIRDATGKPVRIVGSRIDITARRQLEQEREALLESERQAREAAEAAARERDAVLGIVSHDLGAPLTTIALAASAIGSRDQPFDLRRKAVDLIDRAVSYMQHLISDLTDVASIEAGHLALDLADEDPAAIVSRVGEMLGAAAADRGVGLETRVGADLPLIRADAARLLQALTNLGTNAVQFTERGGSVSVRAEAEEAGVRFTVEDTGQGIAPDDLPHVFDRYWQKRHRANRHGTGLGLAITRGIVEVHGSSLRAESTVGVGSRFSFTIPAANQLTRS